MEERAFLESINTAVTQIRIDYVTADVIGVSYNTLAGNMPNTYGNFVAIWQNHNSIPWNQEPLKTQPIATNTQAGSLAFLDLPPITNNSYIIGYAVGPVKSDALKFGNVCSTAFVPASSDSGETVYQYFQSSLVLQHIGSTSLAIQFNLPDGYQAATNKSWLGLWRASVPSYHNPPLHATPITQDSSFGTAAFNNISLGRGITYAVALFMSGWAGQGQLNKQTAMACSLTFTAPGRAAE